MKVGKNTAVMAIFGDQAEVDIAVSRLRESGFRSGDISVLMANNVSTKDFAHSKETKAPEGVTVGATTGAVVGGTLGWLTGIGAIALTGFGPLIAAGPIMAALAGVGVGGAVGSVAGALIGMGIPEYEAKRYEGLIKEGKALLSVHCDDSNWVDKAKNLLKDCGGKDIGARGEEKVASDTPNVTPINGNKDQPYVSSTL